MGEPCEGTFTLCVSRLYRRAVGVSDVEDVSFAPLSASHSLNGREVQVGGFHIPVELMEVYVGRQGADDAPLWCPGQGCLIVVLMHDTGTEEFPEEVSDIPIGYSFLDRFD